mmetsp:Transcript_74386/g.210106  ORF Transcript_74386/g.210106 Transcript_74386/m.210106 type:complete len:478 (-) Transcript_74386:1239-2672(-)
MPRMLRVVPVLPPKLLRPRRHPPVRHLLHRHRAPSAPIAAHHVHLAVVPRGILQRPDLHESEVGGAPCAHVGVNQAHRGFDVGGRDGEGAVRALCGLVVLPHGGSGDAPIHRTGELRAEDPAASSGVLAPQAAVLPPDGHGAVLLKGTVHAVVPIGFVVKQRRQRLALPVGVAAIAENCVDPVLAVRQRPLHLDVIGTGAEVFEAAAAAELEAHGARRRRGGLARPGAREQRGDVDPGGSLAAAGLGRVAAPLPLPRTGGRQRLVGAQRGLEDAQHLVLLRAVRAEAKALAEALAQRRRRLARGCRVAVRQRVVGREGPGPQRRELHGPAALDELLHVPQLGSYVSLAVRLEHLQAPRTRAGSVGAVAVFRHPALPAAARDVRTAAVLQSLLVLPLEEAVAALCCAGRGIEVPTDRGGPRNRSEHNGAARARPDFLEAPLRQREGVGVAQGLAQQRHDHLVGRGVRRAAVPVAPGRV